MSEGSGQPRLHARSRGPRRRAADASLWKIPRSPRLFILSVEVACITWLTLALTYQSFTATQLIYFGILLLISVVYMEGGARVEKLRQFVVADDNPTISNATSLWSFAAALILPPGLAGAFTAVTCAHRIYRAVLSRTGTPHRMIYSAAADVLTAMMAASVIGWIAGSPTEVTTTTWMFAVAVLPAMVTYAVVNQALIGAVLIMVMRPARIRSVFASFDDEILELGMMSLSVLLAVSVVHARYLAVFTLPLIFVLRRSAVVRELQRQASTDSKTGLLNSAAWRREADKDFVGHEHLSTPISVLMVDLDHFKRLNDVFGHQAGDATLKDVGACLIDSLRGNDKVGRFGGEEFVALLPGTDEHLAEVIAERLRERISELVLQHGGSITASVGVATGRVDQHSLDELIAVADKALYVAKAAGRNQVRCQLIGGPVLEIDPSTVGNTGGADVVDEVAIAEAVARLISEVNGPEQD